MLLSAPRGCISSSDSFVSHLTSQSTSSVHLTSEKKNLFPIMSCFPSASLFPSVPQLCVVWCSRFNIDEVDRSEEHYPPLSVTVGLEWSIPQPVFRYKQYTDPVKDSFNIQIIVSWAKNSDWGGFIYLVTIYLLPICNGCQVIFPD